MMSSAIAIIGMAGRFPGARNLSEFWRNLHDGVESVRALSDAELLAAGVTPEELAEPDYVKRAAVLDDVDLFDAPFFGFSPRDASIIDPQHRHFLECAWEALEDAGHPPRSFDGAIGVYAGSGLNSYLIYNLLANRRLRETAGLFQLKQTGNDKDVLSTRVSYQLNLRGPSINVQTACSTSLVAVHLACQSLLNRECDLALAGGVTIEIPHGHGYLFREGEILSRDGHCRAFDAASSGTVFGSGLGIVALRPLEDAIADRDHIRAVILGSAVNNDGARKIGYLAPSVEGQAEVVAEALAVAGLTAGDISFVETHGTGTPVGDPIEIRALTRAFRQSTDRTGYCALGSLKTNIGHLDAAAGVAGLIKTVLSLEHAQLPASLHFRNPNPAIEFTASPFFVNTRLTDWQTANASPRRAGITSLGIGGTNAHVVLEEAPPPPSRVSAKPCHLLTISAKSAPALDRACDRLAAHLRDHHPHVDLGDVAFTCQVGRQPFTFRRAVVARDVDEAAAALSASNRKSPPPCQPHAPGIAFLFSGQGTQYPNMAREIYQSETVFRETLDLCADRLTPHLGLDLRNILYPSEDQLAAAGEQLNQTWLTQPALFAIEYSLARWWMSLGVEPTAMIGHSIGEYVAACLAGVFSLDDALEITAFRGRLIHALPSGCMLAVPLPPEELHLNGSLSIAAINNSEQCVVSGPAAPIADFEAVLARQSVPCRRLHTSHAFHSAMMDPVLSSFVQRIGAVALHAPRMPYLSNVTGTWITAAEATNPDYWGRHLRQTVRFSDCLSELLHHHHPQPVLLEVGPGHSLAALARREAPGAAKVCQSLRHPREQVSDVPFALRALGEIWVAGAHVNWTALHPRGSVCRVSLPTYPFEHHRFWIDPDPPAPSMALSPEPPKNAEAFTDHWFYQRVWKSAPIETSASRTAEPAGNAPSAASKAQNACWILFHDFLGLGAQLASQLTARNQSVFTVEPGLDFARRDAGHYTIRPNCRSDYDALIADLLRHRDVPAKVIHLWSVQSIGADLSLTDTLDRSFYSPLFLTQALAGQDIHPVQIVFVSNSLQSVSGEMIANPARAALLGPARVIPKELPDIICRAIDLDCDARLSSVEAHRCAAQILDEISFPSPDTVVAYRHGDRFVEALAPFDLPTATAAPRLRSKGVYLITGALGGIGLVVAEHLARHFQARLVLVARSPLPPESDWEACLSRGTDSETTKQKIRKLIELRALGAEFTVVRADVTNPAEMRQVVALARRQYGQINGVFHAAGTIEDSPLLLKTAGSAARVLDPKVRGTAVLEEALRDSPIDCFVLFSSISSFFPPAGQVDYAAANAFLDAFALSRKGPVIAIDWAAWRDVGMASASRHPLVHQRLVETPGERIYSSRLSALSHWPLAEHRLAGGTALLPGSAYLEMAAAALDRLSPGDSLEFEDVFFLAPLTVESAESKEVRIHLTSEANAFRFSILARGAQWVEHAAGSVSRLPLTQPSPVDRAAIQARCSDREITFDQANRTIQERYLDFGPRWRSLHKLRLGKRECLAELELAAALQTDSASWRIHPALLDMATGCALYLIDHYENTNHLYLPVSYGKFRSYSPIPPKLFSHIRSRGPNLAGDALAVFDVTLFDERGQVVAEADGFSMRRLADSSTLTLAAPVATVEISPRTAHRGPSEVGNPLGIPFHDGAQALVRILLSETPPVVVVSPQEIAAPKPAPPIASSSAIEPTTPPVDQLEETLAAWWSELLGTSHITPDDDFFDLGGHSLVALRLFSKIRKAYHLDLGLATLFEARTIRQLAALIRAADSPAPSSPRPWSPLVPIQPLGSSPPLFLVHALGAGVLFYNDLSKHLGLSQPVYGLQSPFASSDQTTGDSLEELASLYVGELRRFLPNGPYLLGGASLGGLIALEMSRQLDTLHLRPELLLLLDAAVPGSDLHLSGADQVVEHWRGFRRQGIPYLFDKLRHKAEFHGARLTHAAKTAVYSYFRYAGRPLPVALRGFAVEQSHGRALHHYNVQPYPGKITLIRAIDLPDTVATRPNPTLGWDRFAIGGLEIHDVPGGHNSMFNEPNVAVLAETLKPILSAWSRPSVPLPPNHLGSGPSTAE